MWAALRLFFVFIVLGVPAALIGIPWSLLRGSIDTMYRWAMAIIRLGLCAAGIRVRVQGLENIPAGNPCIFMSNHASNLDPPVLLPFIPGRTSVFLKKELMSIPLLGTAMRMGRYVPVSRGRSREDATRSVESATAVLRDGIHMTVFPEGTRSPNGRLLPFKKGAFFLAEQARVPIVPVAITGTAKMMEKGSLKITPGEAVVEFLPAVYVEHFATREELMNTVRVEIEQALEQT